jgi:hypothetical protein
MRGTERIYENGVGELSPQLHDELVVLDVWPEDGGQQEGRADEQGGPRSPVP